MHVRYKVDVQASILTGQAFFSTHVHVCISMPVPISTLIISLSFVKGLDQEHLNQGPTRVHLSCRNNAFVSL